MYFECVVLMVHQKIATDEELWLSFVDYNESIMGYMHKVSLNKHEFYAMVKWQNLFNRIMIVGGSPYCTSPYVLHINCLTIVYDFIHYCFP